MRKLNIRLFFQWSLGILVVSYGLLVFALNNSSVQQRLADMIEEQLEDKLHSEVEIGSVEIGLFNSVQLHDVLLKDQSGKTLLQSKLIFGKIEIAPLLNGEVSLRNISLLDANIALYKARRDSATNFQYVLDAFSSKSNKPSQLHLRINALLMRRCTISYDEWFHPQLEVGRFDAHHIDLHHIDANVSLKCLTNDSINLRIREFSAEERCGWKLSHLRFRLAANRRQAELRDFLLQTPQTRISQEQLTATYDGKSLNNIFSSLNVAGTIEDARIATNDLAPLVPKLHPLNEIVFLSTHFSVKREEIKLSQLRLGNATDRFRIDADATISFAKGKFESVTTRIRELFLQQRFARIVMQSLSLKALPQWITPINEILLQGKGRYALNNKSFFEGSLSSPLGKLNLDATYAQHNLTAHLSAQQFRPSLLNDVPHLPALLSFEADAHVTFKEGQPNGRLELHLPMVEWQKRTYQNITAQATLFGGKANVHVESQDPGLALNVKAEAMLSPQWKPSQLTASGSVKRISPSEMGWTNRWGKAHFAFNFDVNIPHLDLKHPQGHVELRQLAMLNVEHPYHLDHLSLHAAAQGQGTRVELQSDFADAAVTGIADLSTLRHTAERWWHTIMQQSPNAAAHSHGADSALVLERENTTHNVVPSAEETQLAFGIVLKSTDFLQRLLGIDVSADAPIRSEGRLTRDGKFMHLTADVPHLRIGSTELKQITLAARSQNNDFRLLAKALKPMRKADVQVELQANSENGALRTHVQWAELRRHRFFGQLSLLSHIDALDFQQLKSSKLRMEVLPTSFSINDTIWNIEPGNIQLNDGRLTINNLSLAHAQQRLAISGEYARHSEGLSVNLHQFDVGYALSFIGLTDILLGGRATGQATIRPSEQNELQVVAQLDIPHFTFNNAPLGHAQIEGGFNGNQQTIVLSADIKEPNVGSTQVAGFVSLGHKELDLHVKANNTSIAFLNHYVGDIFHNIEGRATGTTRIFGGFKSIDFEGDLRAQARATLPVTGVRYAIDNAAVAIRPGAFALESATISDSLHGTGTVAGALRHRHLHDLHYDFSMEGQNMLMYDLPQSIDMPFYATVFGSGNVRVWGAPNNLNANIRVRTENNSVLTYVLDRPDEADHQLLTFRARPDEMATTSHDSVQHVSSTPSEEPSSKTNIRLNFQVDVQPNSTLRMITDAKSGDVITVHGQGPIQASYYNKGEFQMFGTYTIANGTYDLSIQNLIKKVFTLHPGGTVNFSGNPLNADVNVLASYMVNSASLADLNIGTTFANNTTPVNCLIKFTGKVSNMNLALDFDLPNVGEDEKMMVRNLIASEEERTTQVLYLLGVGRFFTYNYANAAGGTGSSQSELMMKSLLSSTLSSQINNIIANAVGNTNWTFGANVSTGQLGWSDMEVDGLLSGRLLDNRLQFTGKVGYHDRQAATTNFVGDFNVNYLLTPSGTISLKAYSETNDRYFSKSTLTTQGLGLQIKRDFNSLLDLFMRKRKPKSETTNAKK